MIPFNPYDFNKPVLDSSLFADRKKILDEAEYCLALATGDRPQYKNLAIMGARGIGKTSLLNKLSSSSQDNHGMLAVQLTLNNELATSQSALFHQILDSIISKGRQLGLFGPVGGLLRRLVKRTSMDLTLNLLVATVKAAQREASQLPQEELRRGLQHIFQHCRQAGVPAVLIGLDEADLLSKDQTILQILRNFFENQTGYILVLSGTEGLFSNLSQVFSPIQRFFEQIKLGPFEGPGEVLECLRAPLPDSEMYVADESFAADVYALTGGHPYLVKLMGYYSYRAAKDNGWRKMRLSPLVLDAVLQEAHFGDLEDAKARIDQRRSQPFAPTEFELAEDAGVEAHLPVNLVPAEQTGSAPPPPVQTPDQPEEAPVTRLVNRILIEAISRQATDVVLRPGKEKTDVRFKLDGVLHDFAEIPARLYPSVLSRLKIMAKLDIAEKRLPQDGRIELPVNGKSVDIIVYTVPTPRGELVRMAIQAPVELGIPPEQLGLAGDNLNRFREALGKRDGTALVSVYPVPLGLRRVVAFLLSQLDVRKQSVALVWEESWRALENVTQVTVNSSIGLSYGASIRAALRSDPSVLIVGDINELEVAQASFLAGRPGNQRLVIGFGCARRVTTLLERTINLMSETALIRSSLIAMMSAYFVRNLCSNCKELVPVPDESFKELLGEPEPNDMLWRAKGCEHCSGTGYKGSIGIWEVAVIDDKLRKLIDVDFDVRKYEELVFPPKISSLEADLVRKLKLGLTSPEEALDVALNRPTL